MNIKQEKHSAQWFIMTLHRMDDQRKSGMLIAMCDSKRTEGKKMRSTRDKLKVREE